jgi:hypothetical protein
MLTETVALLALITILGTVILIGSVIILPLVVLVLGLCITVPAVLIGWAALTRMAWPLFFLLLTLIFGIVSLKLSLLT